MIFLDTNVVIAAINQRPSHVREALEAALTKSETIVISSVVLFELRYGIGKSPRPERNSAALERFLTLDVGVLPFDAEDAAEAGDIRAVLERRGTPIGPFDTLIAGQARRHGALLVTANQLEFARVPGLRIEDWSRS